jgi:hypothetical protein
MNAMGLLIRSVPLLIQARSSRVKSSNIYELCFGKKIRRSTLITCEDMFWSPVIHEFTRVLCFDFDLFKTGVWKDPNTYALILVAH